MLKEVERHSEDNSQIKLYKPNWTKAYRLISSHFPPIDLFEQVANPADLDYIFALEALTNDRLKEEVGDLTLVPQAQRVSGPGASTVMAAFTHISPYMASRFTDGTQYGVYYAANSLATAIAETKYHREQFLAATNEPDTEITMRCYVNQIAQPLHDIRSDNYAHLHTEDYSAPQQFAKNLRNQGSNGLIYPSIRDQTTNAQCIAAFNPKAVTIPTQSGHYKYKWSQQKQIIDYVLEINLVTL